MTLVSTEHKLLEMCFLFLVPFDSINNLLVNSFDAVLIRLSKSALDVYIYVYKKKKKRKMNLNVGVIE